MSVRRLLPLVLAAGALVWASPAFAGGSYVVRPGDSLWLIAKDHGTTPQRLARLNRLSLTSALPVGLRLRLRADPPLQRYVVQPGDSLSVIAQRFHITLPKLAQTNKLNVAATLLVGTVLRVPALAAAAPKPAAKATTTYVVQAADTLSAIAVRFGTTVSALARANHLDAAASLPVGLSLVVPAGAIAPSANLSTPATGGLVAGATDSALGSRLAGVIDESAQPGSLTAAIVVDLATRKILYERDADTPVAPASLEKLPLGLAAFESLGSSFQIDTQVLASGPRSGGVLTGNLVLKGFGDPTLDSAGLDRLAEQVRAAGIDDVRGRVLGDASFFDDVRGVTGWKPSFVGEESPPLSALVVDRATLDGSVSWDPAAGAAELFRRALEGAGVRVSGGAATGTAPAGATLVARIVSPTLGELIDGMTKESDNFVAEMLLKQLGARSLGRGTSEAGAEVVRSVLARDGLPPIDVVDGSGLSRLDAVSPRALVALLLRLHQTPALVQALPVAGVDGTLARRLAGTQLAGHVQAKSGTTDGSSGLAGFVDDRYAFVLVSNATYISQPVAHALQDAFVLALGSYR